MPEIIPRSALWPGQLPRNNDGTLRPLLLNSRPYQTVHYTGASVNYGDFGDSPAEIRSIQAWAASAAKRTPWEYNYVHDTEGQIWEYAGLYQAAHSGGENHLSFGHLLLLGVNDEPTLAQIESFKWLRWVLTQFQNLASDNALRPHKEMPDAQTACPGDRVMRRFLELLVPWENSPLLLSAPVGVWLVPHCQFKLMPGDSPWTVAHIAYGDGRRYPELIAANPGAWAAGHRVIVPNENGVGIAVQAGDSPWGILKRVWPMENPNLRLNTFLRWNGGSSYVLHAGEKVWCPVEPSFL